MSGLRLSLRREPEQRLDLSPVVAERLAGLNEADIARIAIGTTREAVTVGDVFTVHMGDVTDLVIEGGSERLDCVGAGMRGGSLRVTGRVGARAAHGMRDGVLTVDGEAGPFAAGNMSGGRVTIGGNAGSFLGAPDPGERAGMRGGMVLVRGHAGEHAATRLRRGTVVIEGDAGEYAGWAMLAGTLIVCGRIGAGSAGLMRRGTVVAGATVGLGPGFTESDAGGPVFLRLLAAHARGISAAAERLCGARLRRMTGDVSGGGQGEVFLAVTG